MWEAVRAIILPVRVSEDHDLAVNYGMLDSPLLDQDFLRKTP